MQPNSRFSTIFVASLMGGNLVFAPVALGAELTVTSQVPEILASELSDLPMGPSPEKQGDNCDSYIIEPTSAAGRQVQDKGWGVVAEQAIGSFELVSFAGVFTGGTSGSCSIQQSNVGVFQGTQLQAILYTSSASDELIGQLVPLEDGDVRLWSGDILGLPVADLAATSDTLLVKPVAPSEAVCSGTAIVPNIYGMPITKARKILSSADWVPVQQPEETSGQQVDLHRLGIIEAMSCSGTGFGFCSYEYAGRASSLTVTSVGELFGDSVPTVSSYGVVCS